MRVFVTGATGFIGSVIVQELLGAGHQVLGLARSDASAASLVKAGAQVHRGSLEDLGSLRSGAAAADGVIHAAFIHDFIQDFSKYALAAETDKLAIEAIGDELAGSGRPLVVTAGTAGLTPGRLAIEDDEPAPTPAGMPRRVSEETALALVARGVRASVVRLSPSVHGEGDYGFVPALIGIAREKGVSAYIGDGLNRWPAVHRIDAAHLFRLALEKSPAEARYHGVADEGVPIRDIAGVIGRHLNLPIVAKSPEEAAEHFGWIGGFLSLDNPTSSALTQERLGWHPAQSDLITDLEQGHYFQH